MPLIPRLLLITTIALIFVRIRLLGLVCGSAQSNPWGLTSKFEEPLEFIRYFVGIDLRWGSGTNMCSSEESPEDSRGGQQEITVGPGRNIEDKASSDAILI